jgi:hypothetical protein
MTSGIPQPPDEADRAVARRQQELLERGDDVVQQLTAAKFALALGDVAAADAAVDAALTHSRRNLTDLVDTPELADHAGKLVRTEASGRVKPPRPRPRRSRG